MRPSAPKPRFDLANMPLSGVVRYIPVTLPESRGALLPAPHSPRSARAGGPLAERPAESHQRAKQPGVRTEAARRVGNRRADLPG
jgi:hypothetical protein